MTIQSILYQATKKLKNISDTPQLDAEVLLNHALNKTKEYILTYPEYQLKSKKIYKQMSPATKKYEPKMALLAPENGMYYYRKLLEQAPKYLKPNRKIFLEPLTQFSG